MNFRTIWIMISLHILVGIVTGCASITRGLRILIYVER